MVIWGAKKAECEHRSQSVSSDWTRSANLDREGDGAKTGESGILSEDEGKRFVRKTL